MDESFNAIEKDKAQFSSDEMLRNLEQKLREDNEFLNRKINDIIEISNDDKLIEDALSLTSLVNKFVLCVIKKQQLSSFDEHNLGLQVDEKTTLAQVVNAQADKDYFLRTLQTVQGKVGILGKKQELVRKPPVDAFEFYNQKRSNAQGQGENKPAAQAGREQDMYEEEKKQFKIDDLLEEAKISEEEKELIELYGPKIQKLRWFFENDEEVQALAAKKKMKSAFKGLGEAAKKQAKKVKRNVVRGVANMFGGYNNYNNYYADYGDEIDDEDEECDLIGKFANGGQEDFNITYVNGVGYTALSDENSKAIETAYQEFLKKKKATETYIQYEEDIYEIKFSMESEGVWKIKNTNTEHSRLLIRRNQIHGPFIENKTYGWRVLSEDKKEELDVIPPEMQDKLSGTFERAERRKKDKCKFVTFNGQKHFFVVELKKKEQCYLLNVDNYHRLNLVRNEKVKRWDYLQSFKPPRELSVESGTICKVVKLPTSSQEYQFVTKYFTTTMNGQRNYRQNLAFNGGVFNGGVQVVVKSVEKIFNCVLYDKFMNEFRRMLRKYPDWEIKQFMKHLFHGSSRTNPKMIYESEDGLDIRFSNAGAYGQGVYFANNSQYSSGYAFTNRNTRQMFLCMVLVGDSVKMNPGNYRIPPNKPNSKTERYDSINNGAGGHYIVYDNTKIYPAYLISY